MFSVVKIKTWKKEFEFLKFHNSNKKEIPRGDQMEIPRAYEIQAGSSIPWVLQRTVWKKTSIYVIWVLKTDVNNQGPGRA